MNAMIGTESASKITVSRPDTDSRIASEIKELLSAGHHEDARNRFEEIIDIYQARITRIAYYYLRDPAEADEAIQDAFLKAFIHLPTFRDELYFELWLSRIAVNGCLDRLKAKSRRRRWILPGNDQTDEVIKQEPTCQPSAEQLLLAKERRGQLLVAVDQLPKRQRSIVILNQFEGYTTKDVADMLGLAEATVRVHLFRAIRALRLILRDRPNVNGSDAPR